MQRIRFLGPFEDLEGVLRALQELEVVHLGSLSSEPELASVALTERQSRRSRQIQSILADCEATLSAVGTAGPAVTEESRLPRLARLARRLRRRTDRLVEERATLDRERQELDRYLQILEVFGPLIAVGGSEVLRQQLLLLRPGAEREASRIEAELERLTNGSFELRRRKLPTGEIALLALVPREIADRVESLWRQSDLEEIPAPRSVAAGPAAQIRVRAESRAAELVRRALEIDRELHVIAREHGSELRGGRARLHDLLNALEAVPRARRTRHAFVLEGWVPDAALARVRGRVEEAFGSRVVVEVLQREEWRGEPAPVVLSNPPIFRPFEALVRPFPLPRYGSLDPTPFVAVFFPMFFGLILGDVGYGVVLAVVGVALLLASRGPGFRRDVAHIALSCAVFTVIFGLLYGELFGDLGHRWLGLEPILFDRGEAVMPFLALAVALGFVHLLLGLVVGAAAAWRGERRRHALGRGVAALMVLASGAALLVALEVLPAALFTPLAVGILVLFPVLVALEGLAAPIELLSTLGHVLSYARIMAIGTASVMLAVVANRMVGAMGSVAVGVVFALLFHLVNFALGIFSPAIHSLRLHYVEFFGTFYSPGGARYSPLARWHADTNGAR